MRARQSNVHDVLEGDVELPEGDHLRVWLGQNGPFWVVVA